MRKEDYLHLANTIKSTLLEAIRARDDTSCAEICKAAQCQITACEMIAYGFARRASVNRDAFLRECGL